MRTRQWFAALSLAGACLMMAACIDSKKPISDPMKATPDASLAGEWKKTNDKGQREYLHIGQAGGRLPKGISRMLIVTHGGSGTLASPGDLLFFTSEVGNDKFVNIVFVDEAKRKQFERTGWDATQVDGYVFAKYQIDGDTLKFWILDSNAKRKAIESGKIKGAVEKKDKNEFAYFTDSPENIAAFLTSPEGKTLLAKEPTVYKRVASGE